MALGCRRWGRPWLIPEGWTHEQTELTGQRQGPGALQTVSEREEVALQFRWSD